MANYLKNIISSLGLILLWNVMNVVWVLLAVPSIIFGKRWFHDFFDGFIDGIAQKRNEQNRNSLFGKALERYNNGETIGDDTMD